MSKNLRENILTQYGCSTLQHNYRTTTLKVFETDFVALHLTFVEKWSSADVKTFFCSSPDFCRKMELCGHEDLFLALHLIFVEKWSSANVKTFFFALHLTFVEKWSSADVKTFFYALHLILVGKLHQCAQRAISFHIFRKGAIVQKKLKIPAVVKRKSIQILINSRLH